MREKLNAKLNHVERFIRVEKGGSERKKKRDRVRKEGGRVGKKMGKGRRERGRKENI